MSEDRYDGPRYIKTKEIAAVKVNGTTLEAVLSEVRAMRVDLSVTASSVDALSGRMDSYDARVNTHSGGLVKASQTDLAHEAAIGKLIEDVSGITKRQEDAAKERAVSAASIVKIEKYVDDALNNPMLRRLAYLIGAAVMAWLMSRGVKPL